jgi:hypothetical protein
LGMGAEEDGLLSGNVMPNGAVLAPKTVLDQVGLYDPHISLARLCDYDLWLRVRRRFPIRFVDSCIGEEYGPSTNDSLGHTYPLDHWATNDRMRQNRNHLLTPERFGDLDVFHTGAFESARSRAVFATQTARHLATREWMTTPEEPKTPAARVPRILVIASGISASAQLPFEGLRDIPNIHVRIIDPSLRPMSELAEADALIVVDDLHPHTQWIQLARELGIPVFSYLGDDLPLVATRKNLEVVDGVLTSTEKLAESLRSQGLHDSIRVVQLTAPHVLTEWTRPARAEHASLPTLALLVRRLYIGEVLRRLWPALVETSKLTGQRLRLLVPSSSIDELERLPGRDRVEIVPIPTSSDYFVQLRALNEMAADVVIVPRTRPGDAEFETLHPLLAAAAIGASLVAPASDPYLELDGVDGVTLVAKDETESEWITALRKVISPIGQVPREQRAVPSEILSTRFGPALGTVQLIDAIGPALPTGEVDELARLRKITDWVAMQLAPSRLGHAFGTAPTGRGTAALVTDMHTTLRLSRQLHAMRGRSRPLPGLDFDDLTELAGIVERGERVELGQPLTGVSHLSYPMRIEPGRYLRAHAGIWADGVAGDAVGIEIIDPEGRVRLNTMTELPQDGRPAVVSFDASELHIEHDALHEVRIFARTSQLAFVLERVDRGRLGLRRPRANPLVRFER